MTTHCRVLWLTPRSRWIDGKATFTMATSRTTMNCAAQQEGLHGVPSNVLPSRLRELEEAGIVERRVQAHPGGGVAYALTEYGLELEEPVLRLGFWGAQTMGPPCEGDFISVDSLALALRGAFRSDRARGPQRVYELRIDGKPLRVGVKSGR